MKDGDIFHWSYKKPKDFMPYHCCSQIAIVRAGILEDTYWGMCGDSRHWTPQQAEELLDLTFVANFNDIEKTLEDVWAYYDETDIVDLGHPNNDRRQHVYLRKGAKRNATVMRATLLHTIERSESKIKWAQRTITECREALAKVEAGDTTPHIERARD